MLWTTLRALQQIYPYPVALVKLSAIVLFETVFSSLNHIYGVFPGPSTTANTPCSGLDLIIVMKVPGSVSVMVTSRMIQDYAIRGQSGRLPQRSLRRHILQHSREKLIEPCILAGCPIGGRILDPFGDPERH